MVNPRREMSVARMPWVRALFSENARLHIMLRKLKKNMQKVKLLNEWLFKEVQVQAKVISQHKSLLNPNRSGGGGPIPPPLDFFECSALKDSKKWGLWGMKI